jgi:hypothetical protein
MQKKQTNNIYFQLIFLSNLFPIFCVYKYGWSFFEVLWLYIVEAVLLIVFDAARLLAANVNKGHPNFLFTKSYMAFKLILRRLLIIAFYSMFAIVFIGFMANKEVDKIMQMTKTVGFQNKIFNYALISFFAAQYFRYIFNYIANDLYLKKTPEDYYQIFSASSLVLHIVIVLGAVANAFINKNNSYDSNKMILIIFIIVKTIASIVQYNLSKQDEEKTKNEIYI